MSNLKNEGISEIIKEYSFDNLIKENFKFRIPLYQRKYAWTQDEVTTLLNDLLTFYNRNYNKKYFIGNIVVEEKESGFFDVIDGQQRLTTLYLIAKIIKQNIFELHYEIRPEDDEFLKDFENESKKLKADIKFRNNIDAILKLQKEQLSDNMSELENLLKLCKIVLTILPEGIDIVKYFEVMNNRGKQLEKHQILKAKFLEVLKNDNEINWAKIWDYCSNMNVYVEDYIYYNDLKDEKKIEKIRNDFRNFIKENKIPDLFKNKDDFNESKICILNILNNEIERDNNYKEESYVRKEYGSIVKFPIFLIQVLKIYQAKNNRDITNYKVNDRYLLDYYIEDNKLIFDTEEAKDKEEAKEFLKFLLKMRLLYDYFIFKRNEKDDPLLFEDKNLYSIKYANNKKNILMLQLLFNFTSPQYFAQDWISIVLAWLNKNIEYIGKDDFYTKFESFLEDFDKDLAKIRLSSNISIIEFINKKLIDLTETITDFNLTNLEKKLNKGTSTQHYWFYKLDYLLWKDYKKYWKKENNSIKILENVKIDNFRLKRLNSIEHIQPQNPEQNCKDWNNDEFNIDNFGNLALISNHMNSTLTNQCFDTKKKDIEKQLSKGTIESLKMLLVYSKYDKWTPENCKDHQEEMIGILKNSIIKTD